jgi:5'-nucleotidase/UDP-sugar diphosphatase
MEDQNASAPITLQMASSIEEVTRKGVPHVVDFIVLQFNDVYEAAPVEGGRLGGIARAATLRRQLAHRCPNLVAVMIGDFLAPSPISATTGDGGQHMIEALNAMGLDYATVGNHEFDISESDFRLRIEESRFKWIVANLTDASGQPFPGVEKHTILEFTNDAGEKARVALIGVCLETPKSWTKWQPPIEAAKAEVAALEGKADVVIAMTHLTMPEDKKLGEQVPRLDVLLGGHEHEAARAVVGEDATPIFKADSNARSAFIHCFRYDTQTKTTLLYSHFVKIDETFEEEPETAAIVERWQKITYDTLRAQGNDPLEVIGRTTEKLEGYEADVRSKPTNLTQLIAEAFLAEVPGADAVVFTAGFIRIDGVIPPGDILYFDVVRIFPVNGKLSVLNMPGSILRTFLNGGDAAKGTGGFVVLANIRKDEGKGWLIKDAPIVDDQFYKIVFSEMPAAYLSYPPLKGSGTTKLFDTRDYRAILTDRLRRDLKPAS